MPTLFVLRGNDQGAQYELESPSLGIGRDPSNEIQLHDTEVSRRHAEIRQISKGHTLIDLGSSNGTFVNNRRVQQHALEFGDEIRVGSSVLLYRGTANDARNLSEQINIGGSHQADDDSQILQAMSAEEGKRVLGVDVDKGNNNLEAIYRTTLAVRHTLDIDQLLSKILKIIFEWVACDRGCILLSESETGRLHPKVFKQRHGKETKEKITLSKTILDYVMKRGQGVVTSDAKHDDRIPASQSILKHNIREAICVPMQGRHNNMVGLIYIDTTTPTDWVLTSGQPTQFTEEHLRLMVAIGNQAAMAVEDTRYYSELLQAERLAAIGQTIATLSHHTKNILQGMQGARYLVETGLTNAEEHAAGLQGPGVAELHKAIELIRKGWDITDKNQHKITKLVMDMLTFSKEREPALQPGDLNETVGDVVELMERRAEEMGVKLLWRPAERMPTLTFDPEGIHRAVLNVVTNAIEACEGAEKSRVAVSTAYDPADRIAKIVIEDNGVGIPPSDLERIFQLFASTKKGSKGTGIGLAVSNKIMREHGGKITVRSQLGKGSQFTFTLPGILPDEPPEPSDLDPRQTLHHPSSR